MGIIVAAAVVAVLTPMVIPESVLPEQKTQRDLAVAGIIFFILLLIYFGWRVFGSRESE